MVDTWVVVTVSVGSGSIGGLARQSAKVMTG